MRGLGAAVLGGAVFGALVAATFGASLVAQGMVAQGTMSAGRAALGEASGLALSGMAGGFTERAIETGSLSKTADPQAQAWDAAGAMGGTAAVKVAAKVGQKAAPFVKAGIARAGELVRRARSVSFFSVQDSAGAARLAAGGAPWPSGVNKSLLGEGFYAWGTRAQAGAYMAHLEARGVTGLRIVEGRISQSQYRALRTLDMRQMGDDAAMAWTESFSRYGAGQPHGYDHVIRPTGNFGAEFFFSKDAFQQFKF